MNAFKTENEHIRLRAVEPEDLELFYKWENDPEIWNVSNTLTPFSRFVLKQYIENSHQDIFQTKQVRFMIDKKPLSTDQPVSTIGTIDIFDFDPLHSRAGIGILIKEKKERGKGYAGMALDLMIEYCFKVLYLHQIYCNISEANTSSIHLFRSKGFVNTGRKKEWLRTEKGWEDELFFQLIRPSPETIL